MIRFVLMRNGATFFLFFLAALGVTAAVGGAQTETPKKKDSAIVHAIAPPGLHGALYPPDPDNAALLYYQAMLVQPPPDAESVGHIYNFLSGDVLEETVRAYLQLPDCRRAIILVETATQIPECNWGIPYSLGFSLDDDSLYNLCLLLEADARTLAVGGHYRDALSQCLTLRRFARHIQGASLIAGKVDLEALRCIRDVLASMPSDADILSWLQGQLLVVKGMRNSAAEGLENDFRSVLRLVRKSPRTLAAVRGELMENASDDRVRKEIQALTDEELLARARQSYEKFLNSVLRVVGSDMPYDKSYAELEKLMAQLEEQADHDPVAILRHCASQAGRYYTMQIYHTADFNMLRAAIEVYLALARTGRLPETLPDYAPKDPFSGLDFAYEMTNDGFVLRSRTKPVGRSIKYLEFKVHK